VLFFDGFINFHQRLFCFPSFQLTLPNHYHFPSFFLQRLYSFCIIGFVGIDLICPPLGSCFGNGEVFAACMSMPETTPPVVGQACMKMTVLYLGKTISGLPGNLTPFPSPKEEGRNTASFFQTL